MIYQPELEKQYEVRSLAVLNKVISYKIDSQVSKRGMLDWRRASRESIFSAMPTPAGVVSLCQAYLEETKLLSGSFDFAVDFKGRWWFVECNPDGQWAWLEGPEHEMSGLFADGIMRVCGISVGDLS